MHVAPKKPRFGGAFLLQVVPSEKSGGLAGRSEHNNGYSEGAQAFTELTSQLTLAFLAIRSSPQRGPLLTP